MAPRPNFKVIGGTALAAVALGAGTAIAQSGDDSPELKLDDVVPVSSIVSPETFQLDLLAVTDVDASQSLASPLDTVDSLESEDSVESLSLESQSVESQSVESESVESQSVESQSIESQSVESQSIDSSDSVDSDD